MATTTHADLQASLAKETNTDLQGRERKGNWMQTFSGRQFWPLDPLPEEVFIEDIAHALSLVCRYGGHIRHHYSVGQHCLEASYQVETRMGGHRLELQALLHDAAEAYIGDMIRPLKHSMPEFQAVEDKILAAVGERFKVELVNLPDAVKVVDERMLATEVLYLRGAPPVPWQMRGQPFLGLEIPPMQPIDVELAFLRRFYALGGK